MFKQSDMYHWCILFQADDIEKILCHKFMRFMMMRAENFFILRRKPIEVRKSLTILKGNPDSNFQKVVRTGSSLVLSIVRSFYQLFKCRVISPTRTYPPTLGNQLSNP